MVKSLSVKNIILAALFFLCLSTAVFAIGSGDPNLIGWWKMDGPTDPGNARLVKDYSGNGHNGTMGTSDTWGGLSNGNGIDFSGTNGITFINAGADIVAGLKSQVTISFLMSGHQVGDKGYAVSGKNSSGVHKLSIEAPTGDTRHFLTKLGNSNNPWVWEAFSPPSSPYYNGNYIFDDCDTARITVTANLSAELVKYYFDDKLIAYQTNASGTFSDLVSFTIGRESGSGYDSAMADFRLYDRMLTNEEVSILCKSYDPALEAWYKFDEGAGAIAYDATGNGNDAVISSSNKWNSDGLKGSNCLANLNLYDKVMVTIPSSAFMNIDKQITLSMWIWTDPVLLQGAICRGYDSTRNKILALSIYNDSATDLQYITSVMGADSAGDHTLRWWWGYQHFFYPHRGSWRHLAITKDCDNNIERIYYDGQMQASFSTDSLKTMAGIETLELFTLNSNNWWEYFRGKIDDVRIYSRALTSQEISRIANPDMFAGDFNHDTVIDIKDLKLIAENWLDAGSFLIADADDDKEVGMADYAWLAKNYAPGNWDKPGWRLTFHDEFDGDTLDTTKWSVGYPGWDAGNDDPTSFPRDDHSLYEVTYGILRLVNEKRDYNDGVLKHYVSGLIQTAHKFDQAYGWFECRCKMPGQIGAFPAFWLFPYGGTYSPAAEVDIMEHIHRWGQYTSCNMHWNGYGNDHQNLGAQKYYVPGIWTGFHTYALEWEPGTVTFYADGYPYYSYSGAAVPSVPLWMILNNSLETWHGPIDNSALPSYFEVDYVRVYEKIE